MLIGGFQKFSLIDYPGEISAIVFGSGCNFRCPYCHNPELVNMTSPVIPEEKILSFLKQRTGKLTAVSITGGEPTIQKDLPKFIAEIKKIGFLVKLDTNGGNPDMLEKLIEDRLIDYAAVDIKTPLNRYNELVGGDCSMLVEKSIKIIISSAVNYEFRTTVVKSLLSEDDILKIGKTISGAAIWYLQRFVPTKTLDPLFINENSYQESELKRIAVELEKNYVHKCTVR